MWFKAVTVGGLTGVLLTIIPMWRAPPPESRLVPESGDPITFSQVVKVFSGVASWPGHMVGYVAAAGDPSSSSPWIIVMVNAAFYTVLGHWWLTYRFKQRQSREYHALRN
ncbi:MAG TPA: hypothetical protein VGP79_00780 [Bryobacteraceae bacterium]|nr:hypothetical protein [Bryobacteraceae bacterium]